MDIDIKTRKIREKSGDQKKIRNVLNTINNAIQTSRKKLQSCLTSSASGKIDSALNAACNSLQNIADGLSSMTDGLDTIAGLYDAAEQDISGNKPNEDTINEVGSEAYGWVSELLGKLFKASLKMGAIGSTIFGLSDIWNDDNWVDGLVDVLKLGKNVIARKFDHMKGTKWKKILIGDWNVGKAAEAVKDFVKHPVKQIKSAFKDEVGGYSVKQSLVKDGKELTGTKATAAKGKVFTKWAGSVLTVVDKVIGNVKEFGGDNGTDGDVTKGSAWGKAVKEERFWRETVTEAALEIGKDILIGAAIAAVVGSGGWVAVLGTVAVSMALDVGANAVAKNDKGFTENVSDWLNDRHEDFIAAKEKLKNTVVTKWFGGNASFVTT